MICPNCQAEVLAPGPPVACPPAGGDEPPPQLGPKEIVVCPMCEFFAHRDYWLAAGDAYRRVYQNIPFTPKIHLIRVELDCFYELSTGHRTFEIRKNNQGFRVGHCIIFRVWSFTTDYCNRCLPTEIVYMTDWPEALKPGYVVLGVKRL